MSKTIIDARNIPIHSGIGKMLLCLLKMDRDEHVTIIRHIDDEDLDKFLSSEVTISLTPLKRMSLLSFIIFPFHLYAKFGGGIDYISMDYIGVFFLLGRNSQATNIVHDFMYRHIPTYFSRFNYRNFIAVSALDVVIFMSLLRARVWFVSELTSIDCPSLIKMSIRDSIVSPPFFYEQASEGEVIDMSYLPDDYCLFVGSDRPQKGLKRIIGALDELRKCGMTLVVIGGGAYSESSKLDCVFLQNLSEKEYYSVLSGSRCLLVPSLYEGYCIPIAEAIIHDVPIISSGEGALIEWDNGLVTTCNFDNSSIWIKKASELPCNLMRRGVNISFIRLLKAQFVDAGSFLLGENNAN